MQYPVKTVYLAGPITGLTYGEARHGWRKEFTSLMPERIQCLSPMRGKSSLTGPRLISGAPETYQGAPIAAPSGIVTRDRNDIKTCDAVVANFLGADKASVGTAIEFGWADAYRKPIIMLIEKDGGDNPHWHAMLTEIAGYVTDNMEEAAYTVYHILTPRL